MIEPCDILQCRILIVDDQSANITLLTRLLGNAGYQFVTSTMDPRAVCALHLKNQYDLILLDLLMPQMDGFQVMYALKALEQREAELYWVAHQDRYPSAPGDEVPDGKVYGSMEALVADLGTGE